MSKLGFDKTQKDKCKLAAALKRKIEILQEQVETLERGMFKLHYQMIKAGYEPGDDLYTLAGYELEILTEILGKAEKIIEKEVPDE